MASCIAKKYGATRVQSIKKGEPELVRSPFLKLQVKNAGYMTKGI